MDKPLTVMIVDDDCTTLDVTSALLESEGHRVIKRSSSVGTTMAISREQPDVVLLDLQMPGINGDKLALLIPKNGAKRPLVILYSGSRERDLERLAAACGASAAIEKSDDLDEFLRKFQRAVASGQRTAPR